MHNVHISCHTSLDDLTTKDKRDTRAVLKALHKAGRFSCFDVDHALGSTLTRVEGLYAEFDSETTFPWTGVKLTDAGLKLIGRPPAIEDKGV